MSEPGRGRCALVVDDAAEVRMLLRVLLDPGGFEVTGAADGTEGLRAAIAQLPDVVVLDVQMPGLDGPEVLGALRCGPTTRVLSVMFQTAGREQDAPAVLGLGAQGVMLKPFSPATVANDVAGLL